MECLDRNRKVQRERKRYIRERFNKVGGILVLLLFRDCNSRYKGGVPLLK